MAGQSWRYRIKLDKSVQWPYIKSMRIGHDRIISESDTYCVFAVQIGVTRIGAGGRCLPRTRRGAMTTVDGLVASEVEQIDTETRPNPVGKAARMARAVVTLALLVVSAAPVVPSGWSWKWLRNDWLQLTAVAVVFCGCMAGHPAIRDAVAVFFQ